MNIQLDASAQPPLFRFSDHSGAPVALVEIRITEVGESRPSWWLIHRDLALDDAVLLNLLTSEEADRAGTPIIRDIRGKAKVPVPWWAPVGDLKYGEVPDGFQQRGSLGELKRGRLYQLTATGESIGELEFYG
jgi:hypothetical protein